MTSRERLLCALQGRPGDRVPISTYELVGWRETSWENRAPSYRRLMSEIRERTDCIYMTSIKGNSAAEGFDGCTEQQSWREGTSRYTRTVWHTPEGDLQSLMRVDDGIHTGWRLEHPLKTPADITRFLSMPWQPPQVDMTAFYRDQERLGEKGIMMISIRDPICDAASLFDMGTFLVLALTETECMLRFLDALHERQMFMLRQILSRDVRDVLFRIVGPEYAAPPYLSPEHFRLFVFPYLQRICTAIREAGGYARVHCHGKVGRILDQIAAAGAQGIDPVEPPPDGDISLGDVKALYGRDLCLFGNIELKELENADGRRIEHLVKQAMNEAKSGGGFVLMPTAAPINEPLSERTEANYLAYIDAAHRYGRY